MKTPTVGQVDTGSNASAVDQDHFPVATVKQSTELALVRAVDQLTQDWNGLRQPRDKTLLCSHKGMVNRQLGNQGNLINDKAQ